MAGVRCWTVVLVVGCSAVLLVRPVAGPLAQGPVTERATRQMSFTRSRRLLRMVETKQIESTVKAAGEIRKAILALGDLQKEMERARLPIPTHGSTGQSEHEKGGVLIYTVVEGDTLTAIATRHRVSLQSLIRANREMQDPNQIQIGQRLRIPRVHGEQGEQGGHRVMSSGQRHPDDDSTEDEESAYTYVNISTHAGAHSAQCVLSTAIVCHNPEGHYQEIFNSAANFVAYLQISGSTRQLHRFLPTPDQAPGVYRAYYQDYGPGLVYKSKILVLLNTSALHSDAETCLREQRPSKLYSRYRFTWISTGRHVSEGGYFQQEPAAAIEGLVRFHEPATTIQRDLSKELRSICSFGDSQMRNNIMWLLTSRFPECTGFKDSTNACPSTKSGYFNISYAADFLAPPMREVYTSVIRQEVCVK